MSVLRLLSKFGANNMEFAPKWEDSHIFKECLDFSQVGKNCVAQFTDLLIRLKQIRDH